MEKEGDECMRKGITSGFDDYIVIEILVRLPMKKQLQCKLVCKRWFSLISSPLFAQRVLATKLPSSMPWFLINRHGQSYLPDVHSCWSNDTASGHNSEESIIPRLTFNLQSEYSRSIVYAAHNGLVLCCDCRNNGRGKGYLVCNPLTGKWVSIPEPRITTFSLIGFIVSFKNGRSQFKVVMAPGQCQYDPLLTYEHSYFEVFSSEVGEWRDTGVSFGLVHRDYDQQLISTVYDGKLVWQMYDRLLIFDLDKKECRSFSLNLSVIAGFERGGLIETCCGRLCYTCYVSKYPEVEMYMSVCVLENYETQEWRQLLMTQISIVVDTIESEVNVGPFRTIIMALHPFNMDIVYFELINLQHSSIGFVSFNLQTNKLISFTQVSKEKISFTRRHFMDYVGRPISLFMLPPWPSSVPKLTYDYTHQDYGSDLRRLFSGTYSDDMDDYHSDLISLFSL